MKLKETLFSSRMIFFIGIVVFIFIYHNVPFIFFQQDEWYGFGNLINYNWGLIFHRYAIGDINHFVPVNSLLFLIQYKLVGLNNVFYNLFSLILHLVNGILIYLLAFRLMKSKLIAFIALSFFIFSSSASELVMWPGVGNSMLSLTFLLLGWLISIKFRSLSHYFYSGLAVGLLSLASVLTIEYSVGVFFIIPLTVILLGDKKIRHITSYLVPFISITILYFVYRFYPQLTTWNRVISNSIVTRNVLFLFEKIIVFPIKYLGQILFFNLPLTLSKNSHTLTDIIPFAFGSSVIAIVLLCAIVKWKRDRQSSCNLILFLTFILVSGLPYILVISYQGVLTAFAPRYLYIGLAGASLLIAQLIAIVNQSKHRIFVLIISSYFLLYLGLGITYNINREAVLYKESVIRKNILSEIKNQHAQLPAKVIFYTESDKSYYGLPPDERIMPFQSGFGQTLLVWFQSQEKFSRDFYQNRFLWVITDEGYKDVENRGFGYFRDFEKMADVVKEYHLDLSSIISYRYDSVSNVLEDMSQEIRGRISGYLANKKTVAGNSYKLTASANNSDIKLASDGRLDTFWSSLVPYAAPISLEIYFYRGISVAQIQINSHENKDQNEVGYRVFLLDDDKIWRQVFYSKRYPPGENGVVNLFFKPQIVTRVKIEQIGFHQFAPWVVNELNIYEATN